MPDAEDLDMFDNFLQTIPATIDGQENNFLIQWNLKIKFWKNIFSWELNENFEIKEKNFFEPG